LDSPELGFSILGLIAVFALLLTNAYFVATEFALVAVRRTQLQLWVDEGRRGAAAAAAAVHDLDDAIAATQLGITLASIGLGFVGEPVLARLIEPALTAVGLGNPALLHTMAMVVSFSIVTFLHVVVGELAPKALALDRPGRVALACARPLLIFARVFHPPIAAMNAAGNGLVRMLGVQPAGHRELVHSPEELSLLVDEARDAGQIRPYAGRILGNVFRLSKTRVRDVMVPREKIFAVHRSAQLEELLDILREEGYTRIPIYGRDLDDVVGILHAKDIFHIASENRLVILEDVLRPVLEIPPDLPVVDALRRFRSGRKHLALVRDPGGPLLGVCTLEDVLEEIVGEIEDEHDVPTPAGGE
jgi:CBS domain containing-hemolysin-like protein